MIKSFPLLPVSHYHASLSLITALFLLFGGNVHSAVITYAPDYTEVESYIGPLQLQQTSDWISLDSVITSIQSIPHCFSEITIDNACFETFENYLPITPYFITWAHPRSFVRIYPEDKVSFVVDYHDAYGNTPLAGYPQVIYWKEGETPQSQLLEQTANSYKKDILLVPGKYFYRYTILVENYPEEYCLETSSFVVTERPASLQGRNIGGTSVTTSRVTLKWTSTSNEEGITSYRLYVGNDPNSLEMIYEGTNPCYDLTSLSHNTRYYWQFEAVNAYGVTSKSPVYSFSTIPRVERTFNYPNPFNPTKNQATSIVFDMAENGSAELKVFSELGDLCWQQSFAGLSRGSNQITYHGRDSGGNTLYNGTYVCRITKRYADREERDLCRLLIIK